VISFVGAGPGAPDLLSLRAAARLAEADVVIWASSLVPKEVLSHVRPEAMVFDSSTMTLEDVLGVYAAHPEPARVVRLHSGDPSLYGALAEQLDWCRASRRPFEIVPGVSSVSAAASILEVELTQPGISQSLVITRLAGRTSASMPPAEGAWTPEGPGAFASHGSTMAVLLSGARPQQLQRELLSPPSAYRPDTPAAVVVRATWPDQIVAMTTVGELARTMTECGATMTVLVLVGEALSHRRVARRSHLYSPEFATAYRKRSRPGETTGRPSARRRP